MKNSKNYSLCIGFLLLLTFISGVFLRVNDLKKQDLMYFDEGSFVLEAARTVKMEPSVDFYYARPGYVYTMGLVRKTSGFSAIQSSRLVSLLGFFISFISILILLPGILNMRVALFSLILFSFSPIDVYYSRLILPDSFSSGLYILSLLLILRSFFCEVSLGKFSFLNLFSGLVAGLLLTVGSYRIFPFISITMIALLTVLIVIDKKNKFRGLMFFIAGFIVLPLAMEIKFKFFYQALHLLLWRPSDNGEVAFPLLFDPMFFILILMYFFPLCLLALGWSIRWLFKSIKNVGVVSFLKENPVLVFFLIVIFAPLVMHSLYVRKALRAVSILNPLFAIIAVVGLEKFSSFKNRTRNTLFLMCGLYYLVFTLGLIDQMTFGNFKKYTEEVSRLSGVVSDPSSTISIAQENILTSEQFKVVSPWACTYNPKVCNYSYKIVSADEYEATKSVIDQDYEKYKEISIEIGPIVSMLQGVEFAELNIPKSGSLHLFKFNKRTDVFYIFKKKDDRVLK